MADPITEQQTMTANPEPLKVPSTLKNLIETLVFAADEPLTVREIKAMYEQQLAGAEDRHIEQAEIQQIIEALNREYQQGDRGYRIVAIAGGFQFATMENYAEWIGRLYKEQGRRKLSQSSLESLAIIAYKQPITKPEIESIRGVNCDYVMKTLLEKDLVSIVGRAETVGRPLLYGTTREFLKHFGLNDVTDLPRPREIEEILGESEFETERRMLEAQAGADATKKEEDDFKSRLPHIPKKKSEMDETVQIVPKKRSRNLKVRLTEETETEQKQMEFQDSEAAVTISPDHSPIDQASPETMESVPEEAPPSEQPLNEVPATPTLMEDSPLEIPEVVEDVEPTAVDGETPAETLSESDFPPSEIPERPQDEFHESSSESLLANDAHSSDHDSEPPPKPEVQTEPELPQPRRSRWTAWKQKLQTFIRNLFD